MSLLTIFVPELQAADNPVTRTILKSIKNQYLRIIRSSAQFFAIFKEGVNSDRSLNAYPVVEQLGQKI